MMLRLQYEALRLGPVDLEQLIHASLWSWLQLLSVCREPVATELWPSAAGTKCHAVQVCRRSCSPYPGCVPDLAATSAAALSIAWEGTTPSFQEPHTDILWRPSSLTAEVQVSSLASRRNGKVSSQYEGFARIFVWKSEVLTGLQLQVRCSSMHVSTGKRIREESGKAGRLPCWW